MNENNQPQSQQTPSESAPEQTSASKPCSYCGGSGFALGYEDCHCKGTGEERGQPASESSHNQRSIINFLRDKGILDADKTQWIVRFSDGKEFDIVKLFEEYAPNHSPTEQPGDAKHTRGPWHVWFDDEDASNYCVFSEKEHSPGVPELDLYLCRLEVPDEIRKANAELIARAPALLSEVSTLRSKQAELVAENARLKAECSSHEKERYEIYSFDSSQAMEIKVLQKELEQLRSERDKMREALEVSKKALYQIVDDARLKGVKYTAKAFGLVNGAYVKVESALSGGSK